MRSKQEIPIDAGYRQENNYPQLNWFVENLVWFSSKSLLQKKTDTGRANTHRYRIDITSSCRITCREKFQNKTRQIFHSGFVRSWSSPCCSPVKKNDVTVKDNYVSPCIDVLLKFNQASLSFQRSICSHTLTRVFQQISVQIKTIFYSIKA